MNCMKKIMALVISLLLLTGCVVQAEGPAPSSGSVTYAGATTITSSSTQTGKTYSSSTSDENALLISTSGSVTINKATVSKTGGSSGGDNSNFYGVNAAVLVKGGGTATISGGTVTSSASGANGVFCYGGNGGNNSASGDGTTVVISDTVINTTGSGSGGIMTTGGGIMKASNLTITTSGGSSAPIRTDRGGGTVTVDGGTYTSSGLGSPAIYSTAKITVSNAKLTSKLSEGVCIEGKNSITLKNCTLTASNTKCNGNATFLDTVMIYQSMSGDADSGTSSFTMTGGTLNSKNGHVFHVTNTSAVINLSGVNIVNSDSENILLSVCDDGWSGASNIATLNASGQKLSGTMLVGSNSKLTLSLTDGSSFTGSISGKITNSKGTTVSSEIGSVSVSLDSSSTWKLTADTYITSFSGRKDNIQPNGHTLYVNGEALISGSGNEEDTEGEESEGETVAVSKIRLNKSKVTLAEGETLKLKVKLIKPSNATNQNVKWTSSDKTVAKVSSSGKVTAVGTGSCVITCTARDGSGVKAKCKITVK